MSAPIKPRIWREFIQSSTRPRSQPAKRLRFRKRIDDNNDEDELQYRKPMSAAEKAFMEKRSRMSYEVDRPWKNNRVPEPYISTLLHLWSYVTPEAARISSQNLRAKFLEYDAKDDFIGMDLACKLIQKGAVVAYQDALFMSQRNDDAEGVSSHWSRAGRQRRLEQTSSIFWEVWKLCDKHEGYNRRTLQFLEEQKRWWGARGELRIEPAAAAETPKLDQPKINTFDNSEENTA